MSDGRWKNVTSFSRGETDRTPRSWENKTDNIRVVVHRHIDYPEAWLVSCYDLNIRDHVLDAKDIEKARPEGIEVVLKACWSFTKDLIKMQARSAVDADRRPNEDL